MMKIKADQDRQMAWDEDEAHQIGLKIVAIENLYTIDEIKVSNKDKILRQMKTSSKNQKKTYYSNVSKKLALWQKLNHIK